MITRLVGNQMICIPGQVLLLTTVNAKKFGLYSTVLVLAAC